MKKLAVIFPGMGYTTDGPLLYYAGKIVKNNEFDVVKISYGKLPEGDKAKVFDYAMNATNVAINRVCFENYDKIFFISKSLGTAVAGTIQKNLPQKVYNIFFTPVTESVPFICEDSLVFTGNQDPLVHISDIMKRREDVKFDLHVAKGANHSLETGDIKKDILVLSKIEEICERYILDRLKEDEEKEDCNENSGSEK